MRENSLDKRPLMYYLCRRAAISGAGFEMKIKQELLRQIIADLVCGVPRPGLNRKSQNAHLQT